MSASDYFLVSANIITHDYQKKKLDMVLRFNFVRVNLTEINNYILDQHFALTYVSDNVESIWIELK